MWRIIFACVLATATVCGHAADLTTLYLGPNGQPLAQGKYWQVGVSFVNGEPVLTKTVLFEVGSGPIPPPPTPDITAQISALIAAVTADPTKAETSKGLAEAYKQILANSGPVKDAATLRRFAEMLIDAILADPKVAKTATWKPFTDGMKALTAPMDLAGVLSAYTIAQGLLGGGPVPPPPPPPPTTAVKAAILIESETQTAEQATLINQWRNDKAWSKLLLVLDPQQKSETGQLDPQTQRLLSSIGNRPLPRLVLLDAAGGFVADEPLPATWDATKALLTGKGVKP
jgi:hypothetical protein